MMNIIRTAAACSLILVATSFSALAAEEEAKTNAAPAETTSDSTATAVESENETAETPADGTETAAAATDVQGDGEPRALVLDLIGDTDPMVAMFDEINDGASILLGAETEIAMTYYPTCEDLTIRGGKLTFNDTALRVEGGKVVARAKSDCPGSVKLSPADVVNAAIVTRSTRMRPEVSPQIGRIVLAGPNSGAYNHIAVYAPGKKIIETEMIGRGITWPEDAPELEAGKSYIVVMRGPDIQTYAARVRVVDGASPTVVLRIP